jgi:hypothetical protein
MPLRLDERQTPASCISFKDANGRDNPGHDVEAMI